MYYMPVAQVAQVYWVCPLIEESEAIQAQAATDISEELTQALSELSIGLIHGRMHSDEKNRLMRGFQGSENRCAGGQQPSSKWV